jgi:3-methyl-2-oxobutanoate hydroxymethyltransferase
VTEALSVPVIGIGAGPHTDGQILVLYDVLGITTGRKPRFVLDCMAGVASVPEALRYYVTVTKASQYPAAEHCFF